MNNINNNKIIDVVYGENEMVIQLSSKHLESLGKFKMDIMNRSYHAELARQRNTDPATMAFNYEFGAKLELGARLYLIKNGMTGVSKVDLRIRDEHERKELGHNYDLTCDGFNFNCKSWNKYSFLKFPGIKESYLFQKTALKEKYDDNEYLICGVVGADTVEIRAVLPMARVVGLLTEPRLEQHRAAKRALYAADMAVAA